MNNIIKRVIKLVLHRPKGYKSLLFNTTMAKLKITGPLLMPVHISIEPTNICNLKCPVCETGNGTMIRPKGLLDIEKFKKFIDNIVGHTTILMFYFMGEPFLNKNSYEMIKYARSKNIYVETCTNGDYVDPEGVIYSDINEISFQIGGITQETHEIYRIRGQLSRVVGNLTKLIKLRDSTPGSNTLISIGFVVMKHNEHEVKEFIDWANSLGVDRAYVIDPCVRNVEEGKKLLPEDPKYWFYDKKLFDMGILKPKKTPENECTWIWNSAMINWNGDVVPCCRDTNGHNVFGNIFEKSLKEIWNGNDARSFRKKIVQKQKEVGICDLCSGYGVPKLLRSRPVSFVVERLSLDTQKIENNINIAKVEDKPSYKPVNFI